MFWFWFGKPVAQSVTADAPLLAWAMGAATLLPTGGVTITADAPSVAWVVPESTFTVADQTATADAPSLSWVLSDSTLSMSVAADAPSVGWAVDTSTFLPSSAVTLTADAPSVPWVVSAAGTIGGDPPAAITSLSPACGGLLRFPQTNEIRVPDPNVPATTAQLNTVLKQLREMSQRLGNLPLVQQLDLTSRVSLMPTSGEVVAEYDDVIHVLIDGLGVVTAAKPPGMQGSTGGYAIGGTVYIQMMNGGTATGGGALPGSGVGTGIPGVVYTETTPTGGGVDGFTGTKGGETVVTAVSFDEGDCELTVTTGATETLTFVNGRLTE